MYEVEQNKATPDNAKDVHRLLRSYKDIFPFLRFDYIQQKIEKGNCIYEDGVVIIYIIYKRKNKIGTHSSNFPLIADKGDVFIYQLANKNPSNGMSKKVVLDFLNKTVKGKRVYLGVNKNNHRAIKFYKNIGFIICGETTVQNSVMGPESWVMEYQNV